MRVGIFHVGPAETVHTALAARLIASLRAHLAGVPIVHLTDPHTVTLAGVNTVVRLAPAPLAVLCLQLYAAAGEGEWLFLDTDTIVQRDVRHVFERPFDVAVADRTGTLKAKEVGSKFMARMPFNKGAVFSRSPEFWFEASTVALELSAKRQAWLGDQEAMNLLIAGGAYDVAVLPSAYNYPPRRRGEDLRDQAIVHYKGDRKSWLLEAA